MQVTVQKFGHEVLRHVQQILVSGRSARPNGPTHVARTARALAHGVSRTGLSRMGTCHDGRDRAARRARARGVRAAHRDGTAAGRERKHARTPISVQRYNPNEASARFSSSCFLNAAISFRFISGPAGPIAPRS